MKQIDHDEIVGILEQTHLYKRIPDDLRSALVLNVLDVTDEIQIKLVNMSNKMHDEERQTMREHIVFLGTALENERHASMQKTRLLQRLLDPEDLGHAVTPEVRKLAYGILTEEAYAERDKENKK